MTYEVSKCFFYKTRNIFIYRESVRCVLLMELGVLLVGVKYSLRQGVKINVVRAPYEGAADPGPSWPGLAELYASFLP